MARSGKLSTQSRSFVGALRSVPSALESLLPFFRPPSPTSPQSRCLLRRERNQRNSHRQNLYRISRSNLVQRPRLSFNFSSRQSQFQRGTVIPAASSPRWKGTREIVIMKRKVVWLTGKKRERMRQISWRRNPNSLSAFPRGERYRARQPRNEFRKWDVRLLEIPGLFRVRVYPVYLPGLKVGWSGIYGVPLANGPERVEIAEGE